MSAVVDRLVDRLVDGSERVLELLGDGPARARAEQAVRAFARGAALARAHEDPVSLGRALVEEPGFAWEGAALVAAADGRFEALLAAYPDQAPWLYIGLGWADALAGRAVVAPASGEDRGQDQAAWLRLDGYGFWLGLRYGARMGEARDRPASPNASALFDQGVGRSLYFVHGGAASGLARAVRARGTQRAPALWVGVGIAAWVTGGVGARVPGELEALSAVGGAPLRRGLELGEGLVGRRFSARRDP